VTRVLLLTAPACHYCEEAKALLARLADEFAIAVEERSTGDDEGRALALASGVLFPPAIFVNDVFVQYGRPSERKLRARLAEVGTPKRAPVP
jgi:glutaredoxin